MKQQGKLFSNTKVLSILNFIGVSFILLKIITYIQWSILLLSNNQLPEYYFLLKIAIKDMPIYVSITTYVVYIICYILVLIGLNAIRDSIKFLSKGELFNEKISFLLEKASKLFLIFIIGIFTTNLFLALFKSNSISSFINLFSGEIVIFSILPFMLLFISNIIKQGTIIKKDNDLTI